MLNFTDGLSTGNPSFLPLCSSNPNNKINNNPYNQRHYMAEIAALVANE
jgi:hypothetical protein